VHLVGFCYKNILHSSKRQHGIVTEVHKQLPPHKIRQWDLR